MSLPLLSVIWFAALVAIGIAVWMVIRDLAGSWSGRRGGALAVRPRAFWDQPVPTTISGRLDRSFDRLMWETGWELTPLTGFLVLVASGLFLGGLAWLYFDAALPGIVGGAFGMATALVVFLVRRHRRMQRMAGDLPHLFELLARAVDAGQSFEQAIRFAADETPGPLGAELTRCARHLEMGSSIAMAMTSLAKRIRLSELRMLSAAASVHRRAGGHLPTALNRMAGVARTRLNYRRQMKTSTAAARMSALVIAGLAPLLFAVFLVVRPDHLRVLFEHETGQSLLVFAAVLQIVGLLWISRLIRTEED